MITTKTGEQSDKDGMTLDEVIAWAEDAKKAGIPGGARVTAEVTTFRRCVKKIEVKG